MSDLICHVHVGMPKTGTSAIQSVFFENPDPNILYVPFPNANHSTLFAVCFENRPEASRVNKLLGLSREQALERRRSTRKQLVKRLNKGLENQTPKALLVSGERLSNATKANEIAHSRFRDFFSQWSDKFLVHAYARPLQSLIASDFQQRIQTGHGTDINLDWYYPNYRKKLEKFETVFGPDAVSIRHFSRDRLLGGDVVSDFASQIGARLTDKPASDPNEALSLEATALVYVFAKSGRIRDDNQAMANESKAIVSFLKQLRGGKLAFCPDALAGLADRNASDLRWIEDRTGFPLFSSEPAKGTVIRFGREFLDIAHSVVQAGIIKTLQPLVNCPSPETVERWVKQDLNTLVAERA